MKKLSYDLSELVSVDDFKKSVDFLRIERKMKMKEIAKIADVDPGTFSKYYNDLIPIPTIRHMRITSFINTLLTVPLQAQINPTVIYGKSAIRVPDSQIVYIPRLGTIPAGPPSDVKQDDVVELIPMNRSGLIGSAKDYYILRVEGDSMKDAGISDGDEVLIRYTTDIIAGKTIAAKIDGQFTLKKCSGTKGELLSMNEKHGKLVARDEIQILGIAEKVIKKL